MFRCSSLKMVAVPPISKTRQLISTILVATCSITIGMCMEWFWCCPSDNRRVREYRTFLLKSLMHFGMILSASPAAFFVSLVGFQQVLMMGMLVITCGSISAAYVTGSFPALYAGRIMHGLGAGIVFVAVPNYVAEIAEPGLRDVLIGLHYLFLLIGMFLSHFFNDFSVFSDAIHGILCMVVISSIALLFIQDPPNYRLKCKEKKVGFDLDTPSQNSARTSNVTCNRSNMNLKYNETEQDLGVLTFFMEKRYRQPLMVNCILICIQQFCGFVSLTSQVPYLYGLGRAICQENIISAASTIIIVQIVVCILCLIMFEFMGKKSLLQISGFGMVVLLFMMNVAYDNEIANHDERFLLKLIYVYIFFYSIGYGPIPWILMPQMSPRKSRLWTSGFTVSLYALLNINNNQPYYKNLNVEVYGLDIFIFIFTVVCVFGVICTQYVPETKQKCNSTIIINNNYR